MDDQEREQNKEKIRAQFIQRQSELDQSFATISDSFPPMWRRVYLSCEAEGFTKIESFKLLQTFILSNGRICPPEAT